MSDNLTVQVGNINIGNNHPIVVQSMTDTDTANVDATIAQILDLVKAGSEIVRITVNDEKSAAAVSQIKEKLLSVGCTVPLVGDFHYNGHRLLSKFSDCAQALDKYRINPGNVGFGVKKDLQFAEIISIAIKYNKAVRIGVNWGSLDQNILSHYMDENKKLLEPLQSRFVMHKAMVASALESAEYAEKLGLSKNKIILSCKVSDIQDLVAIYEELDRKSNYVLHLGLTEAGMGLKAIIASSIGLGILLHKNIGNTIRVSLTPEPNASRIKEVEVCREILQSLGLRAFMPKVTSCPGCGRTTSSYFRELSLDIQNHLTKKMIFWKEKYTGVEYMKVAVMGCIVNGPGESKHANIGISLPGTGEMPTAPVFTDGRKSHTLRGPNITSDFIDIINSYVDQNYSKIIETN